MRRAIGSVARRGGLKVLQCSVMGIKVASRATGVRFVGFKPDSDKAKTRPKHQSDALEAVLEVPAIEISGRHFAVCEGGGGATGHPAQFIRLKAGEEVTCNYCSLRYKYAEADDPAGPPKWAADP